jgi:hypothetical protein
MCPSLWLQDRSRQPGSQSAATSSSSGATTGGPKAEVSSAGGAGKGRRISAASVEDDLPGMDGGQTVLNTELLPQFVIEVSSLSLCGLPGQSHSICYDAPCRTGRCY